MSFSIILPYTYLIMSKTFRIKMTLNNVLCALFDTHIHIYIYIYIYIYTYIYISIYIKINYFYGRMWARICCAAILQIPRETSSYLVSMFLLSDEVPEYRSLGAIASHKNSVNGKIPFFMVFLRNESF